jgi:hypothetical protein
MLRVSFNALRRWVDGLGKPAISERSHAALAHPADHDRVACPLADDARAGHPERPLRDVEHVIGRRFPLHLHREDNTSARTRRSTLYSLHAASNSRAPKRPNTRSECRFCGQLCKKAEHSTSMLIPSGAWTSKLSHQIRSRP